MNQHIAPFIALEGMDGSGKTTLLRGLMQTLDSEHFFFTREPGGTPPGNAIRNTLLNATVKTQLLGFFYDRSHHTDAIALWRKARHPVITDRFDGSTFAYQVVAQSKSDEEREELDDLFWTLRALLLIQSESIPTLYLYLDLPPEVAYARRQGDTKQVQNHYDRNPLTFYEKQREGYLEFFREIRRQGDSEVVFLDATLSEEELLAQAIEHISKHVEPEAS